MLGLLSWRMATSFDLGCDNMLKKQANQRQLSVTFENRQTVTKPKQTVTKHEQTVTQHRDTARDISRAQEKPSVSMSRLSRRDTSFASNVTNADRDVTLQECSVTDCGRDSDTRPEGQRHHHAATPAERQKANADRLAKDPRFASWVAGQ